MRGNERYDAVKRVWKPVDDAGALVHGRLGSAPSMTAVYFTFEKSAGMRTSLPSCRFTTKTDTAFGSKLS